MSILDILYDIFDNNDKILKFVIYKNSNIIKSILKLKIDKINKTYRYDIYFKLRKLVECIIK